MKEVSKLYIERGHLRGLSSENINLEQPTPRCMLVKLVSGPWIKREKKSFGHLGTTIPTTRTKQI